jgi:hypothetical protein
MAWVGWFQFGGNEIINASRTEKYASDHGWFKPVYKSEALEAVLGDSYTTPFADNAPWIDSANPLTYDFYGCYPLSVTGIDDSTATATVTEGVLDGGVASQVRRQSRAVVFSLALVGASDGAVEAGMRWLRSVTSNAPCGETRSCAGDTLCFLSSEPCVDWETCNTLSNKPVDCFPQYLQGLYRVTTTVSPTVTRKMDMADGGAVWLVSMTLTAVNPYVYSGPDYFVRNFMGPHSNTSSNPYVDPNLPGRDWDADGIASQESNCWIPTWQPLTDPLCPAIIPPPSPVQVALNCYDFPQNFRRRYFVIPNQVVPLWDDLVPTFTIKTGDSEVRPIRVRFYAEDPFHPDLTPDECSFCGEMTIGYIPANSIMVIDAVQRTIYCSVQDGPLRRADSLVYGNGGQPFSWPLLTCGYRYRVTVDMLLDADPPTMDMTLYSRSAA